MSGTTSALPNPMLMSAMYGPGAAQGSRPLFADAPVQQQPQMGQVQPNQSLLAALMRGSGMPQMSAPNFSGQIPLASMLMNRGTGAGQFPGGQFPAGWSADATTGVPGYNPSPQTYMG